MIKKLLAIIVLVMVASLSIAGCTSSTNSSQTPSAATQHDAFLENYLTAWKNEQYSNNSTRHTTAWELDWINGTSARVLHTALYKSTNVTWAWDETVMVFPTTQDATNYVNAMNKTTYSLASTEYLGGPYQTVTGHAPQIYKFYQYNEINRVHYIGQYDNLVQVFTATRLS